LSLYEQFSRIAVVAVLVGLPGCSGYVSGHLSAGDALFARQQYGGAVEEYLQALRLDRNNPHGIRQVGLSYYNLGQVHQASIYLLRATELTPGDADVRLRLANLYLIDRQPDRVLAEANEVLAAHPTNRDALKIRGMAHLALGTPADAIIDFRGMAALDSTDADAHILLGNANFAAGDRLGARREYERALSLSSTNVDAAIRLVELDLGEGRTDDALALTLRIIGSTGPSVRLANTLGAVYAMRHQLAAAESSFRVAIALDPKQVEARIALADLLGRSGSPAQGLDVIRTARQLDSTNVTARVVEAQLLEKAGRTAEARRAYEEAANATPDNALVAANYGWFLYRSREYERAMTLLLAVSMASPGDAIVQYHLGLAAIAAGDTATARAALGRAAHSPVAFAEQGDARAVLSTLERSRVTDGARVTRSRR